MNKIGNWEQYSTEFMPKNILEYWVMIEPIEDYGSPLGRMYRQGVRIKRVGRGITRLPRSMGYEMGYGYSQIIYVAEAVDDSTLSPIDVIFEHKNLDDLTKRIRNWMKTHPKGLNDVK